MENIHSGHRERMKERFREHGLGPFSDVEAIETLLFYALPRRNTNEIAHILLDRFGSFRGVMEADIDELREVGGIGENAAILIRLVSEMNRRYLTSENRGTRILRDCESAGKYILPLFAYVKTEEVYVLSLGSGGGLIRCHKLAKGMSNKVDFSVREVVEIALKDNAAAVMIAHNHLSDTALPSNADLAATYGLMEALKYIGVELADHIIVCGSDFVSMRDSGYFINR